MSNIKSFQNTVLHNGQHVDFDGAVALMDDDICERIHFIAPDLSNKQSFFDLYCAAHYVKFGDEFIVN